VPARLYRDAGAAASGNALVWVHGGAFIGGHLDMPESNWVARALAAGAVTRLRDAGNLLPAGLVLVYPVLHPNWTEGSESIDPASPHGQLTLNYAGSEAALTDPRAFAGLGDGHGFPPTLIVVCERDELRPSGERFAATLTTAGVDVELHVEAGAEHGHIDHPGDAGALHTLTTIEDWILER
jgi:acetyl esterase/lipase